MELSARFRNAEDLLRFVDERINHRGGEIRRGQTWFFSFQPNPKLPK